jgi:hypothetical protein
MNDNDCVHMRRWFSAPMLVALLALVVATSGTTYAAIQVTGKDVVDGSLTTKDVQNRSLLKKDFKKGQLPAGPQGPVGPQGLQGVPGAKGDPGQTGPQGPGAAKIDVNVVTGQTGEADIGDYTLVVSCTGATAQRSMLLTVTGPGGQAEIAGSRSQEDVSPEAFTTGALVGQGLVGIGYNYTTVGDTSGKYYRFAGTVVVHGATVTTAVLDMLLDNRNNAGVCRLVGTAVSAS